MQGREREKRLIRKANRASALGRLLLGEFREWKEFCEAADVDLDALPRRALKSGINDVQRRLAAEVKRFFKDNFDNISEDRIDSLYEAVGNKRGLEMALSEFQEKFGKIKNKVLLGAPPYSTVVISLWGLKFRYPEHDLINDIAVSIYSSIAAAEKLKGYRSAGVRPSILKQHEIAAALRQYDAANRHAILSSYHLMEAYLNGIAWVFIHCGSKINSISNNARKSLESTSISFRDKLLKYPQIISGEKLWEAEDDPVRLLLTDFKHFRDSIVHPSPFSVPERFGGYDKLHKYYSVDSELALQIVKLTLRAVIMIHGHINGGELHGPKWLEDLLPLVNYNC